MNHKLTMKIMGSHWTLVYRLAIHSGARHVCKILWITEISATPLFSPSSFFVALNSL